MTPQPPMPPTPDEIIARLERRLLREREARVAAEAIAETGTRALYAQTRRLELLETISTAANRRDDPADAFREALRAICEFTGWPIGHVWMFPDDDPDGALRSSRVWRGAEDAAGRAFRAASETQQFVLGRGLPGRVLETGHAVWIEDLALDGNFPRAAVAADCGLRAGFAFPALIGDQVGAVLEFFQDKPAPPDPELLTTLDQAGGHLGRVVERYRASRRMKAHNETLAELYAQAETQRAAAEEASRAKSAFLAVTSHEIRTPLNAVLGLAEALKREPLTPRQHELNDGVLASGQMLMRLLNAVLDLSRIEADQAEARIGDVDMAATLRAIVSIWTPHAQERGVALRLDITDLDAGPIRTDVGRIEQTLVNLVSNALKFTPAGAAVTVRGALNDDRLRLEVVDGGPGVTDEERARIFQPFEQTEAGRSAGGAGLGLAICAGNVAVLGGAIGADRTEAGESRFWFECPVADACDTAPDAQPAPAQAAVDSSGLRILAADDHPANRRVLEVLLEPLGVDVTFAEDGRQALDALAASRFDLVLMDANMPVMDGIEAVRCIRSTEAPGARLPIHMLTANAFAEDVERYRAAGADGVLTKPIDLPALYAVIAAVAAPDDRAAA